MPLCERCNAEIIEPAHRLPLPWFDHDLRLIAGRPCSATRWRLLEILWHRRNRYVSRDALHYLLYEYRLDDAPTDVNVLVLICYLRRLLRDTPYKIECRKFTGYRLVEPLTARSVGSSVAYALPPHTLAALSGA